MIGKDPYLGYSPLMELDLGSQAAPAPMPALFADLNGDGKPDIILPESGAYGPGGGNMNVVLSTPTGFAPGKELSSSNGVENANGDFVSLQLPVGVGVGSFSGSNNTDIAAVYADAVQVYQNDGTGAFTDLALVTLDPNATARAAAFADLNDDGIPDLVVVEEPNSQSDEEGTTPLAVWTFLADGHGGFIPTTPAAVPLATTDESIPTSMTLADIDGDKHPDVVLGSDRLGDVRTAVNDGTGTMRPPTSAAPFIGGQGVDFNTLYAGNSYQAFADFADSGRPGVVVVTTGGLNVYLAGDDETFRHVTDLDPFPGQQVNWVKVGDLNNDGVPDIVCGTAAGQDLAVYLGNGDGTFREAPDFLIPAQCDILNVALADVNGDGKLDAVATLTAAGGFAFGVIFGDGQGGLTFNANTLIPVGLTNTYTDPVTSATLADFNGDGHLDLLVPSVDSATEIFTLTDYPGNGNGTFRPGPVVYTGAAASDTELLRASS